MNIAALFCRECIATMPTWDFIFPTALSVIATLFLLRRWQRKFHRSRLIEDMPTSKVRSASQGYTELIGIARKDEHPIIAPLSGKPCLWWHYTIEKYQRSGKSHSWVTVEDKRSQAAFQLEDTTGSCRVEPGDAEISTYHRRVWYGSSRKPISAPNESTRKRHFLMTNIGGFGRRYRYTEQLLNDDDPLYVLGHFSTDNPDTLTPQQLAGDILRSWKQDFPALIKRFDLNKDGELSHDEWQLARQAAKWQAQNQHREVLAQPATHSISQPQHQGLPFIISSHEQQQLGKKLRNGAILSAIGFLLAGSMSTWLLSSRLIGG